MAKNLAVLLVLLSSALVASEQTSMTYAEPFQLNNSTRAVFPVDGSQVSVAAQTPQYLNVILSQPPLQQFIRHQQQQFVTPVTRLALIDRASLMQQRWQHEQKLNAEQSHLLQRLSLLAANTGVKYKFQRLLNAVTINGDTLSIEQLKAFPNVQQVAPAKRVFTSLEQSVVRTRAPEVWQQRDSSGQAITGQGIRIAIIDTGIDYNHPDLGGCYGANCKVRGGYDFVNDDADPMDDHGHGTHVAAIAAANGLQTGVAPDATLYAYKVLDKDGVGWDFQIIAAIEQAVVEQMHVINMSLGGGGGPDSALSMAANQAASDGTVVVVAAGNSGPAAGTISSPANAEQVISVGAIDNLGNIAFFSSVGPVPGVNYTKPDIVAPGVAIKAAFLNGEYRHLSGTSMAAPHVAGAAALVRQQFPTASQSDIKQYLTSAASSLNLPATVQGAGELNTLAAVTPELVLNQHTLHFGKIDIAQTNWQNSQALVVKNVSQQTATYRLRLAENLPTGLTITGLPVSELQLAPGESATVSLSIHADNSILGYPLNQQLSFTNQLIIESTIREYSVNLIIEKSVSLTLSSPTGYVTQVLLIDKSDNSQVHAVPYVATTSIPVKPGNYYLIASSSVGDTERFYVADTLNIAGNTEINLDQIAYPNPVTVGKVVTAQRNILSATDLDTATLFVDIFSPDLDNQGKHHFNHWIQFFGGAKSLPVFSDIPNTFKLSFYLGFADNAKPTNRTLYFFEHQQDGLQQALTLELDTANAAHMQYQFDDPKHYQDGYRIFGMANGYYKSFGASYEILYNGYQEAYYGASNQYQNAVYSITLAAKKLDGTDISGTGALSLRTGPTYHSVSNTGELVYSSPSQYLNASSAPLFASVQAYFDGNYFSIYNQDSFFWPLFKTDTFTYLQSEAELQFGCHGTALSQQQLTYNNLSVSLPEQCQKLDFALTLPYQGAWGAASYKLSGTLNAYESVPILNSLQFLNDGEVTRLLDSSEPLMQFTFATDQIKSTDINVSYQLASGALWQKLAVRQNNKQFLVTLPKLNAGGAANIRIDINGEYGGYLRHELTHAIWLQQASQESPLSLTTEIFGQGTVHTLDHSVLCTDYCQYLLHPIQSVNLIAQPAPGYRFAGWQGTSCAALAHCEIQLNASKTISAIFYPEDYITPFIATGAGQVLQLNAKSFIGAKLTYKVQPNPGFTVRRQVSGNCPTGRWLDSSTYQTGPVIAECQIAFEFIKIKQKGLPWWLLLPPE